MLDGVLMVKWLSPTSMMGGLTTLLRVSLKGCMSSAVWWAKLQGQRKMPCSCHYTLAKGHLGQGRAVLGRALGKVQSLLLTS